MRSIRLVTALVAMIAVAACTGAQPGWTLAPAPSITPVPSTSGEPSASAPASGEPSASVAPASAEPSASTPASVAPSASAEASGPASAAPSGSAAATTVELTASQIAFDKTELQVPAGQPFQITFINNDASVPHDVAIREGSPTGAEIFKGAVVTGVATTTYDVPALAAGAYGFVCTIHANMTGTLTAS
jgi:plastocyanin